MLCECCVSVVNVVSAENAVNTGCAEKAVNAVSAV